MSPIYFFSADPDAGRAASVEARIRSAVPGLINLPSIAQLAASGRRRAAGPACVLVLAPPGPGGHVDRLIAMAAKHRDRAFFVLLSSEISAGDYKRLVRAGNADWVDVDGAPEDILEVVGQSRARGQGQPAAAPTAVLFLPSAGGVGNTTLAMETALQLTQGKQGKGRRVCLVDLDFQTSHVCDYLDIEPRLQIAEIAANPERLDAQLFDIFVSRHASGLHVLAAPRSKLEGAMIDMMALDALFDMVASRYDTILIDAPVAWHEWSPHVVAAASGIVVTGTNTIPGLRQVSEALATVRSTAGAPAQIAIALNRCERTLLGSVARRHHVDSVLGKETVLFVRNDGVAAQCINAGAPIGLAAPARRIVRDIAGIAAFCGRLGETRAAAA